MITVADIAQKIRSKNAGPFLITSDIFCSTSDGYRRIERFLKNEQVAQTLGIATEQLQHYDLTDLNVIKSACTAQSFKAPKMTATCTVLCLRILMPKKKYQNKMSLQTFLKSHLC